MKKKKDAKYTKGYEDRIALEDEEPGKGSKKGAAAHSCEFKNEKDCEEELEEDGEVLEEVDSDEE